MYRFEHNLYLWLLLLVVVFVAIFVLYFVAREKKLKKFFNSNNLNLSLPGYSKYKSLIKFVLLSLSFIFLVLSLANPLIGSKVNNQVQTKGSDVQFVIDISNSMLAEDIKPNRLEKTKQTILQVIEKMGSDRVGLVLFAGDAFIQLPMTIDQSAAKMFVKNANTDLIATQGTDLERALSVALTSLDSSKAINPAIVLFSDGENFDGNLKDIVYELKKRKISVSCVAVGSNQGGPIPTFTNGVKTGFKKDENGNTIITRPNPSELEQISNATNGAFVDIDNINYAPQLIAETLANIEKTESSAVLFSDYDSLYLWTLIPALFFVLIDFFMVERRMKWQNIFHDFIERRKI